MWTEVRLELLCPCESGAMWEAALRAFFPVQIQEVKKKHTGPFPPENVTAAAAWPGHLSIPQPSGTLKGWETSEPHWKSPEPGVRQIQVSALPLFRVVLSPAPASVV